MDAGVEARSARLSAQRHPPMMTNPCAATQEWLAGAAQSREATPPEALVQHSAGCPRCRGALVVIAADLLCPPQACEAIGCAECEDQLAAFADCEHSAGLNAAIQRFPAVWWHLLVCPECSALCDDLAELVTVGDLSAVAP